MRLCFDIETDGLLPTCTRIHSLVITDIDTGRTWSLTEANVNDGLDILANASELWGHNILSFDLPAIKKLTGRTFPGLVRDTFVISTLIWTDIDELDHPLKMSGKLPGRCVGDHSLEAWGYRLGVLKGEFGKTTDWSAWSPEMQEYCEQDVKVNVALVWKIIEKNYSERAIELEHRFAQIVAVDMCHRGVRFDRDRAAKLWASLAQRFEELKGEARSAFPPKRVITYTKVKALRREKFVEFNPTSRIQVADRLIELGWKPKVFAEKGGVTIDEEVLAEASKDFPQVKPIAELFLLQKRLGYLATGNNALLKYVGDDSRIRGRVVTNRAVTGRCGHSNPNLGQVPRVGSPYGAEFRELFIPSPGKVLVGADASGLEARCLAHFLAKYDDGAYVKLVTEGDVHTFNQGVFGLPPGKAGRNKAKGGLYCVVYGGGDETFGATLGELAPEHEQAAQALELPAATLKKMADDGEVTPTRVANRKRGMFARERLRQYMGGYAELVDGIAEVIGGPVTKVSAKGFKVRDKQAARGYLWGLDGRRLRCRSEHSALNTLLQSAGALLVKQGTVIWHDWIKERGLDAQLVLHVHDEIQAEASPSDAEEVGKLFPLAMAEAGKRFGFRCPLTGEYAVGDSWKATH